MSDGVTDPILAPQPDTGLLKQVSSEQREQAQSVMSKFHAVYQAGTQPVPGGDLIAATFTREEWVLLDNCLGTNLYLLHLTAQWSETCDDAAGCREIEQARKQIREFREKVKAAVEGGGGP